MSAQKRIKRVSFGDTFHHQNGEREIHDILRQLNQAKTANSIEEVGSELLKHIEEENKKKRKDLDTQLRETRRERDMAVEARDRAVEDRSTALRERDVAIFERDTAVSKLSRLASENEVMKLQLRHMEAERRKFDFTKARDLQAQVECQKTEIIALEEKLMAAQSELQTLGVIYSLHKSLSQEQVLKNQFTGTLDDFERCLKQREVDILTAQRQNQDLARRFDMCQKERNELHLKVQELERTKFHRSPAPGSSKLKLNRFAQSPTFQGSVV
ncbi:mirror-image polydactyly gene 1 protein-like [Corticium candelabrum]|uniref:mirror-image polydactyly gene 1 protein-like n=1 Tax=Corticium candelabrum TaxID=121492 RepID=UPI002E25563F|nr:mirror-image polydactyly gene 1 protein-like [Corticium candelabrum]